MEPEPRPTDALRMQRREPGVSSGKRDRRRNTQSHGAFRTRGPPGTALEVSLKNNLRCGKEFGLKARERIAGWERLETTPMPAIATLRDGEFLRARSHGPAQIL